jgi:hypothetical protein
VAVALKWARDCVALSTCLSARYSRASEVAMLALEGHAECAFRNACSALVTSPLPSKAAANSKLTRGSQPSPDNGCNVATASWYFDSSIRALALPKAAVTSSLAGQFLPTAGRGLVVCCPAAPTAGLPARQRAVRAASANFPVSVIGKSRSKRERTLEGKSQTELDLPRGIRILYVAEPAVIHSSIETVKAGTIESIEYVCPKG